MPTISSDPLVTKLPLQTDLSQLKGSEKCTFAGASGQCIGRSAAAATLVTSGSFPILTRRRESSASAREVTKKRQQNHRVGEKKGKCNDEAITQGENNTY